MARIQMSHPRGKTPPNIFPDFEWIKRHENDLLEQYGEVSIFVFHQQIIGIGKNYAEAIKDAENNPHIPTDEIITPMHYHLARNHFPLGLSLKAADD